MKSRRVGSRFWGIEKEVGDDIRELVVLKRRKW
jgi:hypothetical protein